MNFMNLTNTYPHVTITIKEKQGGIPVKIYEETQRLEQIAKNFIQTFFAQGTQLADSEVISQISGQELAQLQKIGIPAKGRTPDEVIAEMTEKIYPFGVHSNHPRFLGFVPSGASYLSWMGDLLTSAYNRHAGSYANFPTGCIIEDQLLLWLAGKAGFTEDCGRLFVSGGSMANLTALTVARDKMLTESDWHLGTAYVSDQTHSSVAKALHMIGIPGSHIRKLPTDQHFRMDLPAFHKALLQDLQQGLHPFVAVASAGTTNTGSVDPLKEIAALCRQYGLWLHVDGAFGASTLLSQRHRHLLDGLEASDSFSWDAHKWLFQTYGCGMVFVKDKKDMINTFHSHPEYLQDLDTEEEALNPWNLGPELTRPARGLKLWLTLQVMGSDRMAEAIDHGFDLAAFAQQKLERIPHTEIISPAQMCVVNFRFHPPGLSEEELDRLNQKIARQITASGYAGVYTTELKGKKVLRLCILNPETSEEDICSILHWLNACCQKLLPSSSRTAAAGGY